jgi:hypothetical protein
LASGEARSRSRNPEVTEGRRGRSRRGSRGA